VDRLDSWLHRQVGWRRAAVNWVMVCPLAIGLGKDIWQGAAFVEVAALSVLAAIPFAGLAAAAQLRWQARHPGKPYPSWRMWAAMWCLTGSLLIDVLARPGHRMPSAVWHAQMVLLGGTFVFWVLAVRQWSKPDKTGRISRSLVSASPIRPDDQ
jgi:hypothetical protein